MSAINRKRADRNQRGTAAIEFALASPIFLALLLGVVEVGFGAYQAMQTQDAAEAGAVYAAEHGWDATGISAAVVNATGASGMTASPAPSEFCGCPTATGVSAIVCTSTCTGGTAPGIYIQVNATLPHPTILPGLSSLPSTFTYQSTVRIQ